MNELRKWRLSDIPIWFKNAFLAILKGEFLVRMRVHQYFFQILYTFLLVWLSIWISIKIENTLIEVEDNRKELQDIEIYHAQKTVELERLSRMSNVRTMLEESGSRLTMPAKPADRIK